ncbi:MAG: glycerophosphodiester phosphodiesterase [Halobacteriaceae archaeon]
MAESGDGGPALIAHRGFAAEHPENTLRAVRAAAEVADGVEVDVRRCGSGEPVVVHDATVDRVTDASGPVSSFDAADLAAVDVLGSGEGIPTLAAVADAVPADVTLHLELKEAGVAADAVAKVADRDRVVVSSFDTGALAAARTAASSVPRALLFDGRARRNLRRARDLDCAFVHVEQWLPLRSRLVGRAHRAGLDVNVWTVTSRRVAGLLARLGVDGLIADSPGVLDRAPG